MTVSGGGDYKHRHRVFREGQPVTAAAAGTRLLLRAAICQQLTAGPLAGRAFTAGALPPRISSGLHLSTSVPEKEAQEG